MEHEQSSRPASSSASRPSALPSSSPTSFPYVFDRVPLKIWFTEQEQFKERFAGASGIIIIEGELLKPRTKQGQPVPSSTVCVFMHPTGNMNMLPLPSALARCGMHTVVCCSRYPNNDAALIMEKVVVDLGACIRHCKEQLGYAKVLLCGWSGGGSLSAFYQSQAQAEKEGTGPGQRIRQLPSGEPIDLSGLIPADGLLFLAAHSSRARILTEWLDPSILDEADPFNPAKRDRELDIFDASNPNQPPYSNGFIRKYRQAQLERNRRITYWVKLQLKAFQEPLPAGDFPPGVTAVSQPRPGEFERCFAVQGTFADLGWMDPQVDPNDRTRGNWSFMGAPLAVNNGPAGLARFCTLRSWLSQWSIDESNADGPRHVAHVKVPVLVIMNSADDACFPSHTHAFYNAIRHDRKEFVVIKGANHYYMQQPDKQLEAARTIQQWATRQGWL